MRKLLFTWLLLLGVTYAYAQQTLIYTHSDRLFDQGKELYNQQKHLASLRSFEEFLQTTETIQAGQRHEAEFYLLANAFELRQKNAFGLIQNFLKANPYSPFLDKIYSMMGTLLFEEDRYHTALEYYYKVNDKHFNRKEQLDFRFHKAYALLETKMFKDAAYIFGDLKKQAFPQQEDAIYYHAYAEYVMHNYSEALKGFLQVENHPLYEEKIAFYLLQIYYYLGEEEKMQEKFDFITSNYPEHPDNAEIYRIKGEIAYANNQFEEAVNFLSKYEAETEQALRKDLYWLGLALIQLERHHAAIPYLQKVTTEEDAITENAYLHLGNAYIKINEKDNARLAFGAALHTNFDRKVREEALLNYALTTYETTAAFGESISALEQFLQEFPDSREAKQVKTYLAMEYMTTNNYEVAYQSIQKIAKPNAKILEAKQYILYQLGTQAFAQQNFKKAAEQFTLSIQSQPNGIYAPESYYWRSESYYRLGMQDKSIADLNAFFKNPAAKNSKNYVAAHYSMGYAYFSKKSFKLSRSYFEKYSNLERNKKSDIFADALNRIGDCYFYERDFRNAEITYTRSANLSPNTGDYALFQSAYTAGLLKNYSTKISRMYDLINSYPKSEYVDDAYYEIGRSFLMLDNDNEALAVYKKLVQLQPESKMARIAAYEIGMIYQNQEKSTEAIEAYKTVIKQYPGSVEAFTALQSLESMYIELNDVPAYLSYVKTLNMKTPHISTMHEDSISYIAAEKQYMNAAYKPAISGFLNYLKNYCAGGKYCTAAQFYLADSYYRLNEYDQALIEYQRLLKIQGNPYVEEALMRSAEITYDRKQFSESSSYFEKLLIAAQSAEIKNTARLGILRCNYQLQNYQKTIDIVAEILADPKSAQEVLSEAKYNRAKAYIALNQPQSALEDLKTLAKDTRTASGAESKYLLAQIHFDNKNYKTAEEEILDFAKKNTPHQYWLARSFILLSDVFVAQEQDFHAKQYLLSLQRNYKAEDEIQGMLQKRLDEISRREKSKVTN